jgi:hypothetical protein
MKHAVLVLGCTVLFCLKESLGFNTAFLGGGQQLFRLLNGGGWVEGKGAQSRVATAGRSIALARKSIVMMVCFQIVHETRFMGQGQGQGHSQGHGRSTPFNTCPPSANQPTFTVCNPPAKETKRRTAMKVAH